MPIVNGTSNSDTIHMLGDGVAISGNDITGTTQGADTVNAGFGDDRVYSWGGADLINADFGNDYVEAGAGNDTVYGEDGNDTLYGGQGTDTLVGGVGQDRFLYAAGSEISGLAEVIDGGADVDTLDFQTQAAIGAIDLTQATITDVEVLLVTANDITLTAATLGGFEQILGTGAVDRFFLAAAGVVDLTDAIVSNIDEFRGTTGKDTFIFTGVDDSSGAIVVNAGANTDTVLGSNGEDFLNGQDGADSLLGDAGADVITGGTANDTLGGGDGNDTLVGGAGADRTDGGGGNDTFRIAVVSDVSGQAERIAGGDDYDRIDFQAFVAGGIVDLSAATILDVEELALSGNDVTLTAEQMDAFVAFVGTGATDRVILKAAGDIDLTDATIANIEEFRGSSGADRFTLTDVAQGQFVTGQAGNDTIRGGDGGDRFWGDLGADNLQGSDGNDTLLGGQDADALSGGVGNDTFQIQQVSDISGLAEAINGGSDIDRLDFQAWNAFGTVDLSLATFVNLEEVAFTGNDARMTAAQLTGLDAVIGTGATDRVILAAAGTADLTDAVVANIDEFRGTAGADGFDFTGVATGQFARGLAGADTLTGGTAADSLDGGDDADRLVGNGGDDVLFGGLGRDFLTGGTGFDRFDYNTVGESTPGALADRILDFVHGEDVVDLFDIDANTEVAGNQAFVFGNLNGTAGRITYAGGVLSADVDGDRVADFEIIFNGTPGVTASDLVL